MSTSTLVKRSTLTAGVVSLIGLSSLIGAKPSQALTLNLPVQNFSYVNGQVADPAGTINTQVFGGFFKTSYGVLGATSDTFLPGPLEGTAVSASSPLLTATDISKLESATLTFDYAFADGVVNGVTDTFSLSITNQTTGVTTFSTTLAAAPSGTTFSLGDIAPFLTTPGEYTLTYQLSEKKTADAAGFNNVVLNIKQAPEPGFTVGLLALGVGAAALKRKRKERVGVLLTNN